MKCDKCGTELLVLPDASSPTETVALDPTPGIGGNYMVVNGQAKWLNRAEQDRLPFDQPMHYVHRAICPKRDKVKATWRKHW